MLHDVLSHTKISQCHKLLYNILSLRFIFPSTDFYGKAISFGYIPLCSFLFFCIYIIGFHSNSSSFTSKQKHVEENKHNKKNENKAMKDQINRRTDTFNSLPRGCFPIAISMNDDFYAGFWAYLSLSLSLRIFLLFHIYNSSWESLLRLCFGHWFN